MPSKHNARDTEPPLPINPAPIVNPPDVTDLRGDETSREPLQEEIDFYLQHLGEWSEHEGKHVLIHGPEQGGFYPTRDEALREGFHRFGLGPFLVKQVILDERPRPLVEVIL